MAGGGLLLKILPKARFLGTLCRSGREEQGKGEVEEEGRGWMSYPVCYRGRASCTSTGTLCRGGQGALKHRPNPVLLFQDPVTSAAAHAFARPPGLPVSGSHGGHILLVSLFIDHTGHVDTVCHTEMCHVSCRNISDVTSRI